MNPTGSGGGGEGSVGNLCVARGHALRQAHPVPQPLQGLRLIYEDETVVLYAPCCTLLQLGVRQMSLGRRRLQLRSAAGVTTSRPAKSYDGC